MDSLSDFYIITALSSFGLERSGRCEFTRPGPTLNPHCSRIRKAKREGAVISYSKDAPELGPRTRRLQRRPEIDALRGVFLVWMTLAHLPTHLSDLVNEPFGFVSSAEGFVFLSALLVARLYIGQAAEDGAALRTKLWKRALRIYGYHLILLACAFTMAAAFAVMAHRLALINLLNFYLAHPFPAIVGSLLLIYCPPLLDILPMYVIFLLITPFLLAIAAHRGWIGILLAQRFCLVACAVRPACVGSRCGRSRHNPADSATGDRLL